MTDTLTPEQIAYVRAWAESGNEPRPELYSDSQIDTWDWLHDAGVLDVDRDRLNSAGLTIAAQARRIEELERENARMQRLYSKSAKERVEAYLDARNFEERCDKAEAERDTLRAVASEAWGYLNHLERLGGRYIEGVPGELMDALERAGYEIVMYKGQKDG